MALLFACHDEKEIIDPVYEFVYFQGEESVRLNEKTNSETAFPLVAQLLAFEPYDEDMELTLEITGTNAVEGVDFEVTPADKIVRIQKGKVVSDTIWITTIDNEAGTDLERTIEIAIKSISNSTIKIGRGIAEPKNASVIVEIADDECSAEVNIFQRTDLSNNISWGSGGTSTTVTGTTDGMSVTVKGDLIGYDRFNDAVIPITLTPSSEGAMSGTTSFGEYEAGDDIDGYFYKFIETGDGSYDLCGGTISIAYDIYWLDGDTWAYWYSVTNDISIP